MLERFSFEITKYFLFLSEDATLIDPVIDEYERHGGSITCVKCAPLRDLFVSSATDKEIRIYSLDEVFFHITFYFNIIINLLPAEIRINLM